MIPSTIVRAYDLGGFGDIAGAMRVASFLHRTGVDVEIRAKSQSALDKLNILGPDVPFQLNGVNGNDGAIHLDVAGHYKDDRNPVNSDVPHNFTEDMDNPQDRRQVVPIYIKTGLTQAHPQVPQQFNGHAFTPMFYRPFREWDLPKPHERDARRQILEAIKKPRGAFFNLKKRDLERTIKNIEKIGFAHLSPQIQTRSPYQLLEHPYFYSVHTASMISRENYGIGMFVNKQVEGNLTQAALRKHWNVVSSDGQVVQYQPDLPTLIFLGPQPQMTTTGLFLGSDMPNLVTGDLSLSDSLYALIAMQGQGFFYETPTWKLPTLLELTNILERHRQNLGIISLVGGNYAAGVPDGVKLDFEEDLSPLNPRLLEPVVGIFLDDEATRIYTAEMRQALRKDIRARFGNDVTVTPDPQNGFYIPPGAPFLLQDATAEVVETLREDPEALLEVEDVRKILTDGVPVSVNINTGVLEPAKPEPSFDYLSSLFGDDSDDLYKNLYKKPKSDYTSLEDVIYGNLYAEKSPKKKGYVSLIQEIGYEKKNIYSPFKDDNEEDFLEYKFSELKKIKEGIEEFV